MSHTAVGIKELKDHLSHYLAEVQDGAPISVTRHGREIAKIIPSVAGENLSALRKLEFEGVVVGSGDIEVPKKPVRLRGRGPSASDYVISEREPHR